MLGNNALYKYLTCTNILLGHLHLNKVGLIAPLMQEHYKMYIPYSFLAFCHQGIKDETEPSASHHNAGPLHSPVTSPP